MARRGRERGDEQLQDNRVRVSGQRAFIYHSCNGKGEVVSVIHIYPRNDTKEHVLEGTTCWCDPVVEWEHPEALVIHNAADGREHSEGREEHRQEEQPPPQRT